MQNVREREREDFLVKGFVFLVFALGLVGCFTAVALLACTCERSPFSYNLIFIFFNRV